jgi:hypothetical protein
MYTENEIQDGKYSIQKEVDFFPTSKFGLKLRRILVKFYIWNITLYGAETWKLRDDDQKYQESSEMG